MTLHEQLGLTVTVTLCRGLDVVVPEFESLVSSRQFERDPEFRLHVPPVSTRVCGVCVCCVCACCVCVCVCVLCVCVFDL